jgi:indole-3-glycerol phosphate synthase/phosphoribosylanthranilate isomerase
VHRSLRERLSSAGLSGIPEIKRRSPSAGDLRPRADVALLATAFEAAGAGAISVLVDARFGGSLADLQTARRSTGLPLLAKGFFRTEAELTDLRSAGADAVLLILRDLDDSTAQRLMRRTRSLDMEALVEVHEASELHRAVALGADIIGVNARDLRTLRVDRAAQLELVARAPGERIVVAESGIETRAQAAAAELAGADAVLVGASLMRAPNPEDVAAAAEAGADLAGFVLAESARRVARPLPVPSSMLSVAIFVGHAEEVGCDLTQLYSDENGHRGRNAVLFRAGRQVARVMDLPWEGVDAAHWIDAARAARRERVVLAGHLRPDNVGRAVAKVRPWCVDAARGLEVAAGVKDPAKVHAFVKAAREETLR